MFRYQCFATNVLLPIAANVSLIPMFRYQCFATNVLLPMFRYQRFATNVLLPMFRYQRFTTNRCQCFAYTNVSLPMFRYQSLPMFRYQCFATNVSLPMFRYQCFATNVYYQSLPMLYLEQAYEFLMLMAFKISYVLLLSFLLDLPLRRRSKNLYYRIYTYKSKM